MLLQTNSYIVPKDRRAEHARLLRRFRQILMRLGCEQFEVYEQLGANWSTSEQTGRFVQIMRFRDRKHQRQVHQAEQSDPAAQQLINEFCDLINLPYQQQQGLLAVGYYQGVVENPARRTNADVAETPDPFAGAQPSSGFGVASAAAAGAALGGMGAASVAPVDFETDDADDLPETIDGEEEESADAAAEELADEATEDADVTAGVAEDELPPEDPEALAAEDELPPEEETAVAEAEAVAGAEALEDAEPFADAEALLEPELAEDAAVEAVISGDGVIGGAVEEASVGELELAAEDDLAAAPTEAELPATELPEADVPPEEALTDAGLIDSNVVVAAAPEVAVDALALELPAEDEVASLDDAGALEFLSAEPASLEAPADADLGLEFTEAEGVTETQADGLAEGDALEPVAEEALATPTDGEPAGNLKPVEVGVEAGIDDAPPAVAEATAVETIVEPLPAEPDMAEADAAASEVAPLAVAEFALSEDSHAFPELVGDADLTPAATLETDADAAELELPELAGEEALEAGAPVPIPAEAASETVEVPAATVESEAAMWNGLLDDAEPAIEPPPMAVADAAIAAGPEVAAEVEAAEGEPEAPTEAVEPEAGLLDPDLPSQLMAEEGEIEILFESLPEGYVLETEEGAEPAEDEIEAALSEALGEEPVESVRD